MPNSRHVRTTLFLDMDKPALEHNVLVTQFGQMIAHDTELAFPKLSGENLFLSKNKIYLYICRIKIFHYFKSYNFILKKNYFKIKRCVFTV